MPQSGNATPITYQVGGRQYVVIYAAALGSRGGDRGVEKNSAPASYIAFALPENKE